MNAARPVRVLFLCTGNSCRSQMAEGWARFLGKGRVEAFSAGTQPKKVHPLAVKVMADVGVDISRQRSKAVESFSGRDFDFVITVCDRAKEECPVWPGIRERIHWSLEDPAEAGGSESQQLAVFRRVRDQLRQRIRLFLTANHIGDSPKSHKSSPASWPARPAHRETGDDDPEDDHEAVVYPPGWKVD